MEHELVFRFAGDSSEAGSYTGGATLTRLGGMMQLGPGALQKMHCACNALAMHFACKILDALSCIENAMHFY